MNQNGRSTRLAQPKLCCWTDNTHVVVLRGTGREMIPVPGMEAFARAERLALPIWCATKRNPKRFAQKRLEMFQSWKAGGPLLGTDSVHCPDDSAARPMPTTPRFAVAAS